MSGLDVPYEAPLHAEVHCRTDLESVQSGVEKVMLALRAKLRP